MTIGSPADIARAEKLARGSYQRNLVTGHETWNGSSLRGRSRSWGWKYADSRWAFLTRLSSCGIDVRPIGKGSVVIGELDAAMLRQLASLRTRTCRLNEESRVELHHQGVWLAFEDDAAAHAFCTLTGCLKLEDDE